MYIEIDLSNTGARSRRRSSILLRFCRAEYCASPFCHPPAGFQCCNHGDVAFPQGERVKGVGRTYASMERLPLLKLMRVARLRCHIINNATFSIISFFQIYSNILAREMFRISREINNSIKKFYQYFVDIRCVILITYSCTFIFLSSFFKPI